MKSLQRFFDTHEKTSYGLKISQNIKSAQDKLHELLLYAIESWLHSKD